MKVRSLDGQRAKGCHNRFDVAGFELIDQARRPTQAGGFVTRKQEPGDLVKVFGGVVEVDDKNGARELIGGKIPDPDSAIAKDYFDLGAAPASLKRLTVDAAGKFLGGLDGAGVGSGIGVSNRVAFVIDACGGEDTASFTSRVRAGWPATLPARLGSSFLTTWMPVPSIST